MVGLVVVLLVACGGPVAPADDCPADEYWWRYQEIALDSTVTVDIGGCATPERIGKLRDSLLFGF